MSDVAAVEDTIAAARGAVATDLANVTAESEEGAPASGDEDSAYPAFTEDELDPSVARTARILTVLTRAPQPMKAAEITDILNQFGDHTSAKVVSGTVSSLLRRGAVAKAGSGLYTTT